MDFLLQIHSGVRWLVLVAGVLALLRSAWGWVGGRPFARLDQTLGSIYMGLVDLNVLLGIVVLVNRWGNLSRAAEMHPLVMILAAIVIHAARRLGRTRDDKTRHGYQAGGVLASLILILIGIQLVAQ